jgi:serine/threonine protein kinase
VPNWHSLLFHVTLYGILPRILKDVNHENVIVTLDVFENEEQIALVTEYMEGGELFDRLIHEKAFTEGKARGIMKQILLGVEHLHSKGIVHRDIKPENVLCLRAEWPFTVKLTDFGLSNILDDEAVDTNLALLSHVGTKFYLAPEVIGKQGYGDGVDIW